MSVLSWLKGFLQQPDESRTDDTRDEQLAQGVAKAVDFAVAQINPRLKLLEAYRERLDAPVRQSVDYLHAQIGDLPPVVDVAAAAWADVPLLRAFFATAQDIPRTLGASGSLRALFDRQPALDAACFALGVTYQERSAEGMSPYHAERQNDLSRRIASFASPWVMACAGDEHAVRQQLYDEWLEYLVAQSMPSIGELRGVRQTLEEQHAVLHEHLKRLPNADDAADAANPAARMAQLQESERRLAGLGDAQAQLEAELDCLCDAFAAARHTLSFGHKRLRLSHLNEILPEDSPAVGDEVAFTLATFNGVPKASRAFFIGRVTRAELPAAHINFSDAERLL